MEDQTFHQSMSKVLVLSQIFGLLPVCNVYSNNVDKLRYKWLSLHTCYNFIIVAANTLEFAAVINLVRKEGLNFHTSGTLSFFIVCLLEHLVFWHLATKWPFIIKTWRQAEEIFLRTPYRLYATFNMKLHIYGLTFLVLFGAFSEHSVLLYNSFHKSQLERQQCHLSTTLWESLYRRERFHLYLAISYHAWLLPFMEWSNLTLAYARSFTDAFIICVSIGVATRFRQLHYRLEAVYTKAMPDIFWTEVRHHYLCLKSLLRLLNKELSFLILLACGNNMYFICFQLFNSFQNIGVDNVAVIAFWYSLIFAIIRTFLTLYIAGTVNDYSRKILQTLRDVPSKSWCLEVQRFSEQLAVDLSAFSGCGLFFMTRKLILAMASTIVTYEIMLTSVINKATVQEKTDYCSEFWLNVNDNELGITKEQIEEEVFNEMEGSYFYDEFLLN